MEQIYTSKNVPRSLSYTHTLSNSICLLQGLQSIYPLNYWSIDQSINRSINPSVNPSIDQSINPLIHRFIDLLINPSIHPSIHWSIHPSIDWSFNRSTHWSIDPLIDWSIHPSIDPLIDLSIHPSIHRFCPKSWIVPPRLQHIVIFYAVEYLMLYCWLGDPRYYYFLHKTARQLHYSCFRLSFQNFFWVSFSFCLLEETWESPMQHLQWHQKL